MNEVKSSMIIEINLSETLMNGILGVDGGGGRGLKQKPNKVITAASVPSHHLDRNKKSDKRRLLRAWR